MEHTIGIVGNGFVGKATKLLFENADCLVYDVNPDLCEPKGLTLRNMLERCLVVFVCVPTPMGKNGECCLDYIESVHTSLIEAGLKEYGNIVILRSTVPAGTSNKFGFCFMPEYLTEANWRDDVLATKQVFLGLSPFLLGSQAIIKELTQMFDTCLQSHYTGLTRQVVIGDTITFELQKTFCNAFLATKVGFCNEFKKYCDAISPDKPNGALYSNVVNNLRHDDRLGTSHFSVPGPDGQHGFGGTCFPKDIHSLEHQMKTSNVSSPIVSSVIQRNETIDRPNKDWLKDKGRAAV
jgi:UDPglucose 6-dehydrogenase